MSLSSYSLLTTPGSSDSPGDVINGTSQSHDLMRNNVDVIQHIDTSFDVTLHTSLYNQLQKNSAIFGIVLSVWTIIVNGIIVYYLLRDKNTRFDAFYIQITNFSVSNILIGAFIIPLTVYHILFPWELGHAFCKTWIIFDVILPFVSLVIIIIMNLDRLLLLTHPTMYKCIFQKCLPPLVVLLPWLVPIVIVYPLWTKGALPHANRPGECVMLVSMEAAIMCPVLTYFLPLLLIIILILQILVFRTRYDVTLNNISCSELEEFSINIADDSEERRSSHKDEERTDIIIDERRIKINRIIAETSHSIRILFLVNILFTAMWFPYQSVTLIMSVCTSSLCAMEVEVSQAITWTGTASSGIVPLIWLLDRNLRKGMRASICRRKDDRVDTTTEPSVEETCV